MSNSISRSACAWMALAAALSWAQPALCDKPGSAGQGHRNKDAPHGQGAARPSAQPQAYFADRHRSIVRGYYDGIQRSGHCPPGLAKKRNGCMPPGQAKKWQRGRALPRDVVFYDIPSHLVVELGQPPAGHRYVRVAADILLITIGTGIVIDAIEDLGRM